MAETRSDHAREPIEQLKRVYQDFSTSVGKSMTRFGCASVLVLLAAIVVGVSFSWPIAIVSGVGIIAVLISISNRVEAPHKARAKDRVTQLEQRYGMTHEESYELILSTRSVEAPGDKNEWKAFVTEVWGQAAASPEPVAGASSSHCPRCKSASVERKVEVQPSQKAHMVGQALFGIVGNVIAGAAFARRIENCECKSCGHKWVNEKGELASSEAAPDAAPISASVAPAGLEKPAMPIATCVACGTPLLGTGPYCLLCMRT